MKQTTWLAGWVEGVIAGFLLGAVMSMLLTVAFVQQHPASIRMHTEQR